jgi:bis(5'-adenosyl)-triphosphatase
MPSKAFKFGPWNIPSWEIFLTTPLSLGLVNLKPVAPGHVLLIPRRVVNRFTDLSKEEVEDLFLNAQTVGQVVEKEFGGESLTVTVQVSFEFLDRGCRRCWHEIIVHVLRSTKNVGLDLM